MKAMQTPTAHPFRRAAWVLCALLVATTAHAQVRVPGVNLPSLPVPSLPPVGQALQGPLQELRGVTGRELARRYPNAVELDPAGEPVRRGELLWLSPSAPALASARAEGFVLLRELDLGELGIRQLVMRPPPGFAAAQAVQRLRELDPQSDVDFNHLYSRSGETPTANGAIALPFPNAGTALRVGLIDSGLARSHPALKRASIKPWGCEGRDVASDHGTAIASLLVGRDRAFKGVQPGAALYAADVYCGEPSGGAAEDVARALAWLVKERVPVINVSLVGPPNRLLERACAAVLQRGHLIVAAVGNDGPAAAPLYPAAYPGVVGVTGITTARRALPEAAQGPHVMFAAPGANVAVAHGDSGYANARGTSYAAPFVAGLLAQALREPDAKAAAAALAQLARSATDLGDTGRDAVYGHGVVGEEARTSPDRVGTR